MDLRANTAVDVLIGPFVDSTDGDTAETALTIAQADVRLSKNGQNMAQKNDVTSAVHDELGYYNCELDATDTNTEGNLVLVVKETGALPVRHEYNVLSEAAWDSLYVAKDTGFMDVNVKAVSEDTTAADNLESACDNYSVTRGLTGTALPAVAAGGAGGIPTDSTGKTAFNDPTAAANADAVWDEATSGHVGAGSFGAQCGTDIDAILVDTNSLNDTKIPNTLNTTASGNIGIDWANVENPTTALDLSGTDIQLCDTITTYTGNTPQTADHTAGIADIPTVAEFNARTLISADYVVVGDTIAGVTTCTTNTDMRGTDSAATAAEMAKVPKSDSTVTWNATALASINAELVDVMGTDTVTLPGQEAPSNTPTRDEMAAFLYKNWRNEKDQTATLWQLKADDGSTVDQKATVSESGGTATKEEIVSGP